MADVNLAKNYTVMGTSYRKRGLIAKIARWLYKRINHKMLFNLGYELIRHNPKDTIIGIAIDEKTILINGHLNLDKYK